VRLFMQLQANRGVVAERRESPQPLKTIRHNLCVYNNRAEIFGRDFGKQER